MDGTRILWNSGIEHGFDGWDTDFMEFVYRTRFDRWDTDFMEFANGTYARFPNKIKIAPLKSVSHAGACIFARLL